MAKSFYYPVSELANANIQQGQFVAVSETFDTDLGGILNEERLIDQSIGTAITSYDSLDTIRTDLGSSVACGLVALYFNAPETADMTLYASDTATDMSSSVKVITASFVKGWNVFTFSSNTKRYWFLRSLGSDGLTEMILGTKYDFDINFDLSNKIGEEFGTDIVTSYGGNEYSNKRHEPKTTWDWNWSFLTSSQKTSLEDLNSTVQDHKKFIYYDETNYHYVRMTKPMNFTEVAPSIYSTSVSLREQLS